MLLLSPQMRHLMPVSFGPTQIPTTSSVPSVLTVSLSFQTDGAVLQKMLPPFFRCADDATVMLSRITYRGVDYLGGRGYSEVLLGAHCTIETTEGPITAPYMLVLWVSDFLPAISGREFMGHAKLMAEIPEVVENSSSMDFSCSEYGTPLLRGTASNLRPVTGDSLERVRQATRQTVALGWKYIQGAEGEPDVTYPLANVMRWDYDLVWTGDSHLEFDTPSFEQAPASSQAMAALARLPVTRMGRAFVGKGKAVIDRGGTRRLVTAPRGRE